MYSSPKTYTNIKLDTLMSFESTLSDGVIHASGIRAKPSRLLPSAGLSGRCPTV